jgi:hypothetical protein
VNENEGPLEGVGFEDGGPNDQFNEAHAGEMEAALLDALETIDFVRRGPIESWRDKALGDLHERILGIVDKIGDARDADAQASALEGP